MNSNAGHRLPNEWDLPDGSHANVLPSLDWIPGAPDSFYRDYDGIPHLVVDPRKLPERLIETDKSFADCSLRFLVRNAQSPRKGELVSVILVPERGTSGKRGIVVCREDITLRQLGPLADALDSIGRRFGLDASASLALLCRLLLDANDDTHFCLGDWASRPDTDLPLPERSGGLFGLDRLLEFWDFVSSMDTLDALVEKPSNSSFMTIPRGPLAEAGAKPVNEPADEAFQAFFLLKIYGKQGDVARIMSEQLGRTIKQYQVSRLCQQVRSWQRAGNPVPMPEDVLEGDPPAQIAMDPAVLEQGPRLDGRSRLPRERPSD